jgi:hypothetical protein
MTEGCNVIVKTIRAHARQFFGVALFWENELNDIHGMDLFLFVCLLDSSAWGVTHGRPVAFRLNYFLPKLASKMISMSSKSCS